MTIEEGFYVQCTACANLYESNILPISCRKCGARCDAQHVIKKEDYRWSEDQ